MIPFPSKYWFSSLAFTTVTLIFNDCESALPVANAGRIFDIIMIIANSHDNMIRPYRFFAMVHTSSFEMIFFIAYYIIGGWDLK